MDLILWRHADAGNSGEGPEDIARPLSDGVDAWELHSDGSYALTNRMVLNQQYSAQHALIDLHSARSVALKP